MIKKKHTTPVATAAVLDALFSFGSWYLAAHAA
jgi:hypothetical protein